MENQMDWIKATPWCLAGVLALLLALMSHLYLSERDALMLIKGQVETTTKIAKQEVQDAKDLGTKNLQILKATYENERIPEARKLAVSNYVAWMRQQSAASARQNANAAGQQENDGTLEKCLADPTATRLVSNAGEDVVRIDEWITYCTRNNCPIED
jgi:hypothetical protein